MLRDTLSLAAAEPNKTPNFRHFAVGPDKAFIRLAAAPEGASGSILMDDADPQL
jgi:hypothetical protein